MTDQTPRQKALSNNKRFDDIEEDVEDIKDWREKMTGIDERTKALVTTASRNSEAIFGTNGIKGILPRMTGLEEKMTGLQSKMDDIKKFGWAIVIASLGIFLELMVQLILNHGVALAK